MEQNSSKQIALTQILTLIIGIFAVAYAVGQIGFVSGLSSRDIQVEKDADGSLIVSVDTGGTTEEYTVQEDDIDEDGEIQEGSDLATWLGTIAGSTASGLATDAIEKTLERVVEKQVKETILGSFLDRGLAFLNTGWWGQAMGSLLGSVGGTIAALAVYEHLLGASSRNVKAASWGSVLSIAGIAGGFTLGSALGTGFLATTLLSAGFAMAIMAVVITFTHRNYSQEVFLLDVGVWKPEAGGSQCEECNDLRYGCNAYQCSTFGKSCEFDDDSGACFASDPNDLTPPEITPLVSSLPNSDYVYSPSGVTSVSAPGVKIEYDGNLVSGSNTNNCIPAFSEITLGINTSEYATTCRIDIKDEKEYASLAFQMKRSESDVYEHTLYIPSSATISAGSGDAAGLDLTEGLQYEFYIKCENNNGIANDNSFVMEFCVDDGPDISPPEILGTNYLQETFIRSGVTETDLEIYTNEPADCRWDFNDKRYEEMKEDGIDFCSQNISDHLNGGYRYGCSGTLTGLKDSVDNNFYIRCKDKPYVDAPNYSGVETRIANEQPHPLTLKGTGAITISEINVNGQIENIVIEDSTPTIRATIDVKTVGGADTGKARCQWREEGSTQYTHFYNDGSFGFVYPNTHDFYLEAGDYAYEILCYDAGGNSIEDTVEFEIQVDREAPNVVRAYHEAKAGTSYLKIVTDENAECVYDVQDCLYDINEGTQMSTTDGISHFTNWNTQTNFYIKCKDDFKKGPRIDEGNGCSIVVKPSRI